MQAQKEAPPDMQCKDKFLVQSVIVAEDTSAKDITGDMVLHILNFVCVIFLLDVCFFSAYSCTLCSLPKNQVMWWMRWSWGLSTSHHPNRHPRCVRDLKKARHLDIHCLMEATWIIKRWDLQILLLGSIPKRWDLQVLLLGSFPCSHLNDFLVISFPLDADNKGTRWSTIFGC